LTSPADKSLALLSEVSLSPAILHIEEYLSNRLQKSPPFQFTFKVALFLSERLKSVMQTQEIDDQSPDPASLELAIVTEHRSAVSALAITALGID